MAVVKLSTAGLTNYAQYSSMLAGNAPFVANAYDLLETTTLTTSASSVTFSGLGAYSDYAHLQLRSVSRGERSNNYDGVKMRLNGDSSNNYAAHKLYANGSSVASGEELGQSFMNFGVFSTAGTSATGAFAASVFDFLDFSNSSKNTTVRGLIGSTDVDYIQLVSGLFMETDPITSISLEQQFGTSFVAGSRYSLFGIKAA